MVEFWQVVPNVLEKFKPLGMTAKGAGAAYLMALVYIGLMVILGIWWNKPCPLPSRRKAGAAAPSPVSPSSPRCPRRAGSSRCRARPASASTLWLAISAR